MTKGTEHIFLVDDEENIVKTSQTILERYGYKVTSFYDGVSALKAFKENPNQFDLVITDLAMPNISGDKLSLELIKIRSDIPILLYTGFSDSISEKKAACLGIMGFLYKPIVIKDLISKIREVLDKNNN